MVYYSTQPKQEKLDYLFETLSNTVRRKFIADLSKSKTITISEFAVDHKLSLQNAGKHVQKLERADLVKTRKKGREKHVRLNEKELARAQKWIARYTKYWNAQLDSFGEYVAKKEKK